MGREKTPQLERPRMTPPFLRTREPTVWAILFVCLFVNYELEDREEEETILVCGMVVGCVKTYSFTSVRLPGRTCGRKK